MPNLNLLIRPLDVLFFRDGKPFDSGGQAESGLPMPQTLAGALRTLVLRQAACDFGALARAVKGGQDFAQAFSIQSKAVALASELQVRGPWLWHKIHGVLVSTPANLVRIKTKDTKERRYARLDPLKDALPGWPAGTSAPLWCRTHEPFERAKGWLTEKGLQQYLNGDVPGQDQVVDQGELFALDRRVGIGIDPATQSASEGALYSVGFLALKPEVSLLAQVEADEGVLAGLRKPGLAFPLGGEGRHATLELKADFSWPKVEKPGQGKITLLTTPAPFGAALPSGLEPLAAAVPGYQAISGWDLARGGPKPLRHAAQAGSVYFFKSAQALPTATLCQGEDAALGWGCHLEGVFNYA